MEGISNQFKVDNQTQNIIKVIGVGGGGSNAVNHMYRKGITDVSFVICNTDDQALSKSPIPTKVQLGREITHGLGAGNKPELARQAAEESKEEIQQLLSDGTRMVFITAGMGGGTGTGAAPIVASIAHEMNILTVGIVTIPFAFEGKRKIRQALKGVAAMSPNVDALLVVNNQRLLTIYPDLKMPDAFAKADDVLTNAAKGIAEIITIEGYINVDFADVSTILRNGGVAVMNSGIAEGPNRITEAITNALNSPLLNNNDISKSKKILFNFYCANNDDVISAVEMNEITEFMNKMEDDDIEVIWGITFDDTLEHSVKVTLLATGGELSAIPPEMMQEIAAQNQADDVVDTPKIKSWNEKSTKGSDSMGTLISNYYPETFEAPKNQPSITLESLDSDPELLKQLEEVPAYKRRAK